MEPEIIPTSLIAESSPALRSSQALAAMERETEEWLAQMQSRMESRMRETLRRTFDAESRHLVDMLETLLKHAIGNAIAGAGASRESFAAGALQRGADLVKELERAKRNL